MCPCGSGRRFKKCCLQQGCFRRRQPRSLFSENKQHISDVLSLCVHFSGIEFSEQQFSVRINADVLCFLTLLNQKHPLHFY
ncbi:MAG: SEC-C metal-binding domain-containing protein [Planctomycetota bacterium]